MRINQVEVFESWDISLLNETFALRILSQVMGLIFIVVTTVKAFVYTRKWQFLQPLVWTRKNGQFLSDKYIWSKARILAFSSQIKIVT